MARINATGGVLGGRRSRAPASRRSNRTGGARHPVGGKADDQPPACSSQEGRAGGGAARVYFRAAAAVRACVLAASVRARVRCYVNKGAAGGRGLLMTDAYIVGALVICSVRSALSAQRSVRSVRSVLSAQCAQRAQRSALSAQRSAVNCQAPVYAGPGGPSTLLGLPCVGGGFRRPGLGAFYCSECRKRKSGDCTYM